VDLFEARRRQMLTTTAPLSTRMRPRRLADMVGHKDLIGEGSLLRQAIDRDQLFSMIFWGPPGSGKTTLARLIAEETRAHFVEISAVSSGVAELRSIVRAAAERLGMHGQRTILFIDEIHRFNKAQQDAVLPAAEDGTVILIGATTENPSFEVNAPLLSRSRIVVLAALTDADIELITTRALADTDRGLGDRQLSISDDALSLLVNLANGDARFALNTLEYAAAAVDNGGTIDVDLILQAAQRRSAGYDKTGEAHYDAISALHKTLRGSDADAALYWLARMLERGDDPLYVARRLVRFATEDVGLADPQALMLAVAAQQAVHFLGMPEGALALAELTVYLALAPKSNAIYRAYGDASTDVAATRNDPVPLHLRNAPTRLMKGLGYGKGYRYAHDYPDGIVGQTNLPENLQQRTYYQPTDRGFERELAARRDRIREIYGRATTARDNHAEAGEPE
jgi:putative ATPase